MINRESSRDEVFSAIFNKESDVSELKNANPEILKDPEFMERLVQWCNEALQYADVELYENERFWGKIVRGNGYLLKYANPELHDQEDERMMFACKKLQDNERIVAEACHNSPEVLGLYASERLQNSDDFLTKLSKINHDIVKYIPSVELKEKMYSMIIDEQSKTIRDLQWKMNSQVDVINEQKGTIEEQDVLIEKLKRIILESQEEKENKKSKKTQNINERRKNFMARIQCKIERILRPKIALDKGREEFEDNEYNGDIDVKIYDPNEK